MNRSYTPRPRASQLRALAMTGLAAFAVSACGDDASVPQPVPVPKISLIRRSSPETDQVETLVVGLPGAVVGDGQVEIVDRLAGGEGKAPASNKGSFVVLVPTAPQGSQLEARFVTAKGASPYISLDARSGSFGPRLGPTNQLGGPVSPPDANGLVTVTNFDDANNIKFIDATPDVEVLVSNGNTGEVVLGTTDAQGIFRVELPAAVGDPVHIVLSDESAGSEATGNYLSFVVPAS